MHEDAPSSSRDLMPLLDHIASALASVRDEAMLIAAMEDIVDRVIPVDFAGLYFRRGLSGDLRLVFSRGLGSTEAERRETERTAVHRHIGEVYRSGIPLNEPDREVSRDPRTRPSPATSRARSRVTIPIHGRGENVGVMSLASTQPHAFDARSRTLLEFVSKLAGVVYWNLLDLTALKQQLDITRAQKEELRRLGAPVLEVAKGVLLLPLVGHVDTERAAMATEKLLGQISDRQAHVVILDLTGVDAVDEASAAALASLVRAAGLMGAQCILSGITSDTAWRLLDLDLTLDGVKVFGSVRAALAAARGGSSRS